MKLVIAEKPSVAKSIAKVLGVSKRKEGYLEGESYLVSWCIGHLVHLADANTYSPTYAKWRYCDLPILPERWSYEVTAATKSQFDVLSSLLKDERVDSVICATDAGREGELIFRLVYNKCCCKKPVERLWISSMEDSAIQAGFQNLKEDTQYEGLYQAALCRAKADWLVGINATRLYSVLYHATLNVGRVMTPTLNFIVQRDTEIANFQKEKFYTVEIKHPLLQAYSEKFSDKKEAEQIQQVCNQKTAVIQSVEKKQRTEKPPKLYDLTTLQREANRIFGYTAQQTLDYVQALYEKKLVTYPRTDSRYLTEDMKDSILPLCNSVKSFFPFLKDNTLLEDVSIVIDNTKVSDHHAIIPTQVAAQEDLTALPTGEKNILFLIGIRLLCALSRDYIFTETKVNASCNNYLFSAKGKTVLDFGWKETEREFFDSLKKEKDEKQEKEMQNLSSDFVEGLELKDIVTEMQQGTTTPPKHYTEDTLLAAMEHVGTKEQTGEETEKKGIGTPATRAGIIEKLVRGEFIERKKKQLIATTKGIRLIEILPEKVKSAKLTAEWEMALKKVEKKELSSAEFMKGILEFVTSLVEMYQDRVEKLETDKFSKPREKIGECPRCRKAVYENKSGFYCEDKECGFFLWKKNRFFESKHKELTKKHAIELLKKGSTKVTGLYSEKTGKTYDATVFLEDTGGKFVHFKLGFPKK